MNRLIALLSLAIVGSASEPKTAISLKAPFSFEKSHIAVGCKTFEKQALNGNMFADKSLLIKEVLVNPAKIIIMNFPHLWGKSVNLNMIDLFLRAEIEEQTGLLIEPNNETSMSFRCFSYGLVNAYLLPKEKISKPLLISKQKYVIPKYLGQNPVIFFTFGTREEGNVINQFRRRIREAFKSYVDVAYVMSEAAEFDDAFPLERKLMKDRLHLFEQYRACESSLDLKALARSLRFLSEMLYIHFKKPVYIFIEDYDRPLKELYIDPSVKHNASEYLQKTYLQLYTNFLTATFKANPHVAKGILTGVIPPLKGVLNESLGSISECNFLTGNLSEYFGFNQWEVDTLFEYLKVPQPLQEQVTLKYNGYHANHKNLRIYNPQSIVRAVNSMKMDSYWVKVIDMDLFLKNFLKVDQFREKLELLINGKNVTISAAHKHFTMREFDVLMKAATNNFDVTKEGVEIVDVALMDLYWNGFLTLSKDYEPDDQFLHVRFPNSEILDHMKKKFYECVEIPK